MQNTREERTRFAEAIGRVALLTTKREKPDRVTIQGYFRALKDFNIDTIEDVSVAICRTEVDLIAVPPPGRWREIAKDLFELRPKARKDPRASIFCDDCQDTNWRTVYRGGVRYVVTCNHQGPVPGEEQAPAAPHRPVSMLALEGEIGPPVGGGETALQERRRVHGNLLLHCLCCGVPYRLRQGRRCECVTPQGMTSAKWLSMGHADCPNPAEEAVGKGKGRCAHHCRCPPEVKNQFRLPASGSFPRPEPGEHPHDFLVRQGLRDADAPGPTCTNSVQVVEEPPLEEPRESLEDEVGF